MIFCCYYWWKSNHPKFYTETVHLLGTASNKSFVSQKDLDAFITMLRTRLDMDKPKGHAAKVEYYGGQITIVSGKVDDTIARIETHKIEGYLQYDESSLQFKNVKKGGTL